MHVLQNGSDWPAILAVKADIPEKVEPISASKKFFETGVIGEEK